MRKKLLALTVGVALTGAVIGIVSVASASSDISSAQTIHLVATTTQSTPLDLGAPGISQGDEFIFHDVLTTPGGKQVGHNNGYAVVTSTANGGAAEFVVTSTLSGGQITFQGSNSPAATTFFAAVTGGTGIYRNVRGQARVHNVSSTVADITISLLP